MSRVVVVGAGPVGALIGLLLKRRGDDVVVYERRGDPRAQGYVGGRSINLALSDRGMLALQKAGVADDVDKVAVPMPGRRMHNVDGSSAFMPYGLNGEFIRSVSRGGLNIKLLDLLDAASVPIHFEHPCSDVDLAAGRARCGSVDADGDVVIGADGAGSAVRAAFMRTDRFDYSQSWLPHGYKELAIPAGPGGSFLLEKQALHIWPRSAFMLIALPNLDGSFTCTLFFAHDGDQASFAALTASSSARAFFEQHFPDALALMPDFDDQWAANPVSSLATIRCWPWHHGKALLIGDAAHAICPFFGQGLNAGFEDCRILLEILDEVAGDWSRALPLFQHARKDNADAIATLALENFVEMRDKVGQPAFLLRKKIEAALAKAAPDLVTPSYTMVTFRPLTPYAEALRKSRRQDVVLDRLVADVDVVAAVQRDPADPALQATLRRIAAEGLS
ncbi:MAG: NAD(P)/FAD-dependent oxidoreductase [Deltaproteobacteria bacterium]|nr:NAD(P)/FAD-dependent oxidoreductase [Deltaproteobacteria bacterium]